MKKLLFLVLSIILIGTFSIAEDIKVNFAVGEWQPYIGNKMDHYGLLAEIVTAACMSVDISPQYNFYPWKRAEGNIIQGLEFATFPYKITDERKDKFYF